MRSVRRGKARPGHRRGAAGVPLLATLLLSACHASSAPAPPGLFYVSDERGNAVIALDGNGKPVRSIAAGPRPRGIQLSPDGATLYVAVSGSAIGGPGIDESKLPAPDRAANGIAVIDLASGTLGKMLKAGSDPETFAVSPRGHTLFVSNEDDALVSAVDTRGAGVPRSTRVGEEPEGIAVTRDGRRLFVACEASEVVMLLDARSLRVIATVSLAGRPRGLIASADGRSIYVTAETAGKLAVLSADTGAVTRLINLAGGDTAIRPMGIAEAGDGHLFVTTGRAGAVIEVDPAAARVVGRVDGVGARPWGIALSRDGKTLITANGPSGDISVIDRATLRVRARHKVGVGPWGVVSR